ncbi:MAG: hypothetical protein ACLUKN_03000 [Bacilli bacterium]
MPQNTILFSNELLDARPFSRFKFIGGKWSKAYLDFSSYSFPPREIFLPSDESETALLEKYFPKAKVQDFRIDFCRRMRYARKAVRAGMARNALIRRLL